MIRGSAALSIDERVEPLKLLEVLHGRTARIVGYFGLPGM
jgi:hypothetical protein